MFLFLRPQMCGKSFRNSVIWGRVLSKLLRIFFRNVLLGGMSTNFEQYCLEHTAFFCDTFSDSRTNGLFCQGRVFLCAERISLFGRNIYPCNKRENGDQCRSPHVSIVRFLCCTKNNPEVGLAFQKAKF